MATAEIVVTSEQEFEQQFLALISEYDRSNGPAESANELRSLIRAGILVSGFERHHQRPFSQSCPSVAPIL